MKRNERHDLVPRRTQFSSCDSCRRSRVACDATKRSNPDAGQRQCSRCAKRNKSCTFEWIEKFYVASHRDVSTDIQPQAAGASQSVMGSSPTEVENSNEHTEDGNSVADIPDGRFSESHSISDWNDSSREDSLFSHSGIDTENVHWLKSMYQEGFEAVFGSWIGNYSCPYTFNERSQTDQRMRRNNTPTLSPSISSLCRQMDRWMENIGAGGGLHTESETERQVDRSFSLAVQAFSAQWLPLTQQHHSRGQSKSKLVEKLWRDIRNDLLKVINLACYRSVFTLLLFALTPIPAGISSEEEGNGLSASVCVHAALQQVQTLRARQKSLEFNGSKISTFPSRQTVSSSPDGVAAADFIDIESTIYWAALTFDTSASLTMGFKPVLSPGLLGFKSERSWRLVRSCTQIFHEETESWRSKGVEITEETSNRIIAAAASWKLLAWKMTAILKEALREGQDEDAVQWAFSQTTESIIQFETTYRVLLAACQSRIQFLSQHTKLRWYELMLHYHLAILIAADAVDVAGREDLMEHLRIYRADAEGNVLNCLIFGLNNEFVIPRLNGQVPGTFAQASSISVPLVSVDPYPHHVVAATQLLWKMMDREAEAGNLQTNASTRLRSTLLRILELLPQTSKSVQAAKEKAKETLAAGTPSGTSIQ